MHRRTRLYVIFAALGLCYAALIAIAVMVVRVPMSADEPVAIPTLFVLPSVNATPVPTLGGVAIQAEPARAVVALAPTNTFAPKLSSPVDPVRTLTPAQAVALMASINAVEPTAAPLWSGAPTEVFVPTTEPESGEAANQVIVRFDANASEAERAAYIESIGGTIDKEIDQLDTVVVSLPEGTSTDAIPESDVVAAAEPDYLLSALDDAPASNDPALLSQWALPAIGAPSAWLELPADASTVIVAVIDSGVCASHPDLANHLVAGWDFVEGDSDPQDELGHGCSVAGVIAADVDNSLGIAGVAPNARIMPLRVLNALGVGRYSDVTAAILYAADHGAQVINLSLGGANSSTTLEDAVDYAAAKGVTMIAASGNTGTEGVLYPAAYSPVIAVGSVDPDLTRSSFSTYGPEVDLLAPGRRILTTTLNGDYGYVSGTSFAAPHVAGVAALDRVLGVALPAGGELVYAGSSAPSAATDVPTASATEALTATEEVAATETATTPVDGQYADLLRQAQENGHVRLIVGLNVGFQPEGELSGDDQVEAQRAAIALAQSDVVSALSAYDVSITAQYEVIPYIALQADEAALRYLIASDAVTSIQEDRPVPPVAVTNTSLIGADASWSMGYTGAGQAVAVLDTGVQTSHPYLGGRVVAERCHSTSDSGYGVASLCPNGSTSQSGSGAANPSKCSGIDACSHGTHVAGIAAGENSSQSGVAPDASIIAVQIFSKFSNSSACGGAAPCLMSYESDQISGLQDVYNLRGTYSIASVNMSLGGGLYSGYCDGVEVSMKSMIDSLRSVGIATVIAAGNDGYNGYISAPGCISTAISVGATTLTDTIASWSNRASFLSLFAPGVSINSSIMGGGYAAWSGTSMATPHVAGALAVLRSYAPGASVTQLLTALKSTGATVSGSSIKRIQIDAALKYLGAQSVSTPTATPTLTPTPGSDVIFADGFESGSLSAWTSASTDSGNLSVKTSAAIYGTYGLSALINDKNKLYVTDDTPNALKTYRARFSFDPNSVTMSNGDEFYLFYGYTGSSTQVIRLELQRTSSSYQLRSALRDDGSTWKNSSWYTINDTPHAIELYWAASTSSSAKNGSLTLWIDGAQKSSIANVDNDTRRIDRAQLGVLDGLDGGTKGTVFFDSFASRQSSYIGAATGEIPGPTPTPTVTPSPTNPADDVVFANGVEAGNLSGWTSSSTDNGNLSVGSPAALVGTYGLSALINDKNKLYVIDDTPNALKTYRARFYFDPNAVTMSSGDEFYLFYGHSGSSTGVVRVELQRSGSSYQLRASIRDDGDSWKNTSWYTVSDAPHAVEIYWLGSTSSSAKNGALTLWIDGAQMSTISGVDNDTRKIDRAQLGIVEGLDSGTKGTVYFDAFESRRYGYIGLDAGASLSGQSADEPTTEPTATAVAPTLTPTPTLAATEMQEATATEIPPTMTLLPTATDAPLTEIPLPTATDAPPTETPAPTATEMLPTETPMPTATEIPPTETPLPTATDVPPTATDVPPTDTPEPPQAEPERVDATEDAGG